MQTARIITFAKQDSTPVARPFGLSFKIDGTSCELFFDDDAARVEKGAELVANGTAVVFKPAQV